jgi:hypothetical protein
MHLFALKKIELKSKKKTLTCATLLYLKCFQMVWERFANKIWGAYIVSLKGPYQISEFLHTL